VYGSILSIDDVNIFLGMYWISSCGQPTRSDSHRRKEDQLITKRYKGPRNWWVLWTRQWTLGFDKTRGISWL